jgi:hypothetical protein
VALAHHLTVFLVGLAFLEWNVLPPEEDDPVHWTVVLLIANIGLVWTTDFFHSPLFPEDAYSTITTNGTDDDDDSESLHLNHQAATEAHRFVARKAALSFA